MDFELKNFEDKINDITEQFMSLLDSKEFNVGSATTRFDNINTCGTSTGSTTNPQEYLSIDFGKIINEASNISYGQIPTHAIKFENAAQDDLNRRLEELYNSKNPTENAFNITPKVAFSDTSIGAGSYGNTNYGSNYTNDKGSLDNSYKKEGYEMAEYGFNGGVNEDENAFFSFATIPQERALTQKRSFADVLFMDIPWDTKIDVWGGIKSLFTTDVKFTF